MASIKSIRPPALYTPSVDLSNSGPSVAWLCGCWYISHSSLPMWRDKRNCRVNYTALPADASGTVRVDDLVHYQPINGDSVQSIHAINSPWPGNPAGWTWRGVGWILWLIRCEWEIFGYGELESGGEWMIMHFRKTWLTGAGLDLFTRGIDGELSEKAYADISNAARSIAEGNQELLDLIKQFQRVKRDA